jgi:hypothetical protein
MQNQDLAALQQLTAEDYWRPGRSYDDSRPRCPETTHGLAAPPGRTPPVMPHDPA